MQCHSWPYLQKFQCEITDWNGHSVVFYTFSCLFRSISKAYVLYLGSFTSFPERGPKVNNASDCSLLLYTNPGRLNSANKQICTICWVPLNGNLLNQYVCVIWLELPCKVSWDDMWDELVIWKWNETNYTNYHIVFNYYYSPGRILFAAIWKGLFICNYACLTLT